MRRKGSLLAGAIALAGALTAAAAFAATITENGHVTGAPNSSVSFTVVKGAKGPTAVTHFGVMRAPATCHSGPPTASVAFPKTLAVASNGTFRGQVTLSGHGLSGYFKLSGKVSKDGRSASGTLNIDKVAPLPIGACKTGARAWTAKAR